MDSQECACWKTATTFTLFALNKHLAKSGFEWQHLRLFQKRGSSKSRFVEGAFDTQAREKPLDPNTHLLIPQQVWEHCSHWVGVMQNLSLPQRSGDGARRSCVATGHSLPAMVGAGPPLALGQEHNVA